MRALVFAFIALFGTVGPATGQAYETLGVGHLFTNDFFGDGQDRWRTGSFSLSWMMGVPGTRDVPENVGELVEVRFGNRVLTPSNTVAPAAGDRRYAGLLTLGLLTHFKAGGNLVSLGGEIVASGPQTGVDGFHSVMHDHLGMSVPSDAVLDAQFGNAFYPAGVAEVSRTMDLGAVSLRPFLAGRVGDENYLRAGADLLFGPNFTSGVLARDETTGMLYQTLRDQPSSGLSLLVGADAVKVFSSTWLPEADHDLTAYHLRARAGASWKFRNASVFFGKTWTGREFESQPEGQWLGSVQILLRF